LNFQALVLFDSIALLGFCLAILNLFLMPFQSWNSSLTFSSSAVVWSYFIARTLCGDSESYFEDIFFLNYCFDIFKFSCFLIPSVSFWFVLKFWIFFSITISGLKCSFDISTFCCLLFHFWISDLFNESEFQCERTFSYWYIASDLFHISE
jgi:hypothetical protein